MKQKNKEVQQYVFTDRLQQDNFGTLEVKDYERMENEHEEKSKTPELVTLTQYTDLATKLEKGDYDRSIYSKWKKKNSKEMEDIIQSTKLLGNILDTEILEGDDFDGILEDVKRQYSTVQAACIKYIDSHNDPSTVEGKARLSLVKTILEHLTSDMRDIDVSAEVFKKEGLGAYQETAAANGAETLVQGPAMETEKRPGIKSMGVRLNTILFGPHVLKIKTGGNIRVEGSEKLVVGTSDMLVLHEGDKKYFFKKKDHVPDKTKKGIVAYVLHRFQHDIEELKKGAEGEFGGLTDEQREAELEKRMLKLRTLKKIMPAVLKGNNTAIYEINYDTTLSHAKMADACKLDEEERTVFDSVLDEIARPVLASAMAANSGIPLNAELTVRNEATTVMADLLGVSDIMMKSQRVTLDLDGKKIEGLRMEEVKGRSYAETFSDPAVLDKKLRFSPEAFATMVKMQVFDLICGQMDRNTGNFMVQTTVEGDTIKVTSVCGIDNDMAFGTLSYQEMLTDNYANEKACRKHKNIEDSNGNITLLGMDKEFAERILALSPAVLETMMGRFLSKDERAALADRLKGVQQALLKVIKEDESRPEGKKRIVSSMEEWERLYENHIKEYTEVTKQLPAVHSEYQMRYAKKDECEKKLKEKLRAEHPKANEEELEDMLIELKYGENADAEFTRLNEEFEEVRRREQALYNRLKPYSKNGSYFLIDAFSEKGLDTLVFSGNNTKIGKERFRAEQKKKEEEAKKKAEEEAKKKAEEEAKN